MKILIIECGSSKLPTAITTAASKMIPKPEGISVMNIALERFNISEFKHMLFHLAPDAIILDPPSDIHISWSEQNWYLLLQETIRHVNMLSSKLVFVSSVEVLGDTIPRTETTVVLPYSDEGLMLYSTETMIESRTSRYYIMRFPNTVENSSVRRWAASQKMVGANESFTLINLEDMAKSIIDKIQTGWFGKYHVTPNDYLTLSDLIQLEWDTTKQTPNYGLMSKYTWKVAKTREVWDKLVEEVKACAVFLI
jgi:hypothetical protein